jgi:hypothetical protein
VESWPKINLGQDPDQDAELDPELETDSDPLPELDPQPDQVSYCKYVTTPFYATKHGVLTPR